MNVSLTMEAVALERILLFKLIALAQHFVRSDKGRNRTNHLALGLGQISFLSQFDELLGVDLDLARRSLERMLSRIGAEALHRDAGVFLHLVLGDALLPELLEARQFGHFLTCVFIALAQPLIVSLALGVFVFNTEALGQFAHDVPVALLPVTRLDRLMHRNEVAVTAHRIRVTGEVVVFLSGNVRQQIIGKLRGRRHLCVDHNKALDQLRVFE